jgi:RNA polymerase II subunit A small phosphatase-like protein
MENDSQPLLIFDLDETLIHASKSALNHVADFQLDTYFVYKRPYLKQVLIGLAQEFRLAIWSSAGDEYVTEVVRQIKPDTVTFEFTWGHSRCTQKYDPDTSSYFNLKNLKKVKRKGYSLKKTLIIDNTPAKVSANYGNAIYIQDFLGQSEDQELLMLKAYLLKIKDQENYTRLEKRFWRNLIE